MGLLKGESWEDYLNKEVYVTANHGVNGFEGVLREYSYNSVLVEDNNGNEHKLKPEYVFGPWILEDW
jgi:hypothetical protein